jgi:hypothetical protein
MRSRNLSIALALAAAVWAGCDTSEPKRAVDARTEVLHFFAVDAPVVALLRPEPVSDVIELDRAAQDDPAWARVRALVLEPLHAAGLSLERVRRLVRPEEEIEDVEAAAFAIGAATPEDLADRRPLLVLATDRAEQLSALMRRSAAAGMLRPSGELNEAELYTNPVAAYAVRDGVLLSAPDLAGVRAAIERRDGDSDEQLDEDVVRSELDELVESGPLSLYGNVAELGEDPEVQQLISRAPWIGSADSLVASVQADLGSVEIEAVVDFEESLEPGDIPFEEGQDPDPLGFPLPGLGAVRGVGSISEDEVRLRLTAP